MWLPPSRSNFISRSALSPPTALNANAAFAPPSTSFAAAWPPSSSRKTSSAPSPVSSSITSCRRTNEMLRSPKSRASWITQRPTPEFPAFCTTHASGSSVSNPCSKRHAVAGFTFSIAACSGSTISGSLNNESAATVVCEAQVDARRRKITRSSTSKSAELLASTTPQPSIPGVAGSSTCTP